MLSKKTKIDKIITKSISRFGRDALDIIQSIRLIKDMGGSVYFDEENIDKSKYLISENHPAIIPKETFDAVQEEKMRRTNITKTANGNVRKNTKYSSKQITNQDLQ